MAQPPPQPRPLGIYRKRNVRAYNIANIPGGVFTASDAYNVDKRVGNDRDLTRIQRFQMYPVWSHPAWDGTYDTQVSGGQFTEKAIPPGADIFGASRPAIRPDDARFLPTEYAKRFGVSSRFRASPQTSFGHSGLTPTESRFQVGKYTIQDNDADASLQTIFFNYTSSELVSQGAYNPRLVIPSVDLNEQVHDLFARHRWDQAIMTARRIKAMGFHRARYDVRYGAILDGVGGAYDALNNQRVWDAIEPALKLASRIIRTDHPFWQAMTDIHHYRPVPDNKDGRSAALKASQGGMSYQSIWLDENDIRTPAPDPELPILKAQGFDSNAARTVCLDILRDKLRFQICQEAPDLDAETMLSRVGASYRLEIRLAAGLIWPLLVNRVFTEPERRARIFRIAVAILHELAHACARAIMLMTADFDLVRATTGFGPKFTPAMQQSLDRLGLQMFGPATTVMGLPQRPPAYSHQAFFEDLPMGEEGFDFENQLFGGCIEGLPKVGGDFRLQPIIALAGWPTVHPQPLQQGARPQDQVVDAYYRYLTDPRAKSWEQLLAIPVEWYARYFQNSWWQVEFQKYQHHGLKLSTNDPTLPQRLLRSAPAKQTLSSNNKEDISIIFGQPEYSWLNGMVGTLRHLGLVVLGTYVHSLIEEAANTLIMRTRLDNELTGWTGRLAGLVRENLAVVTEYQAMVNFVQPNLMPTAMGGPLYTAANTAAGIAELNNRLRLPLGRLLELGRIFSQEVAYQQDMLNKWMLLTQPNRAKLYRTITAIRSWIAPIRDLLTMPAYGNWPLVLITGHDLVQAKNGGYDALLAKITTDLLGGNAANLPAVPADIQAEMAAFQTLCAEFVSVHQTFFAHKDLLDEMDALTTGIPPTGQLNNTGQVPQLQQLANARRLGAVQSFQPAATREILRNDDPSLDNLLIEAFIILRGKLDPMVLDPAIRALQTANLRNVTRQRGLLRSCHYFLVNENANYLKRMSLRAAGATNVGPEPKPEDLLASMRAMANGVAPDLVVFDQWYDVKNIQDLVDGSSPIPPPPTP